MYETGKIIIKPTLIEDIPTIMQFEEKNSEFVGRYSHERHLQVIHDENEVHFSIFDKSDNKLVGHLIFAGLMEPNQTIEFRRLTIIRKGKGLGRDAVKLVKEIGFQAFGAHRIWLDVFEDNHRAISIYESEGFVREGLLREKVKQGNKRRSMWIMSILKHEWK
ncbi:MAG: GNAT family N-acetyltransferase [Mariniphaga sp.]